MGKDITVRGKKWERRNSLWVIWSLLGFSSISFLSIGLKVKEKKWIIIGVMYFIIIWGGMALLGNVQGQTGEILADVIMVVYIWSIVHTFLVRKSYLKKYDEILRNDELKLELEKIKRNKEILEMKKEAHKVENEVKDYEVKTKEEEAKIQNEKAKVNNSSELNSNTVKENMKKLHEKSATENINKENNENKNNGMNIVKWILLPIAIIVGEFFVFDYVNFFVLLIIFAICVFWLYIGICSWDKTCPKCHNWGGLSQIDKVLIGTEDITIKKQVEDEVRSGNDRFAPRPEKVIKRTVYVPGIKYTYNVTYRCQKCGYVEERTECKKVEK